MVEHSEYFKVYKYIYFSVISNMMLFCLVLFLLVYAFYKYPRIKENVDTRISEMDTVHQFKIIHVM